MKPSQSRNDAPAAAAPDPDGRIGIVAGGGRLPVDVAERLQASGRPPFLLIVDGEVPPDSPLDGYEHVRFPIGHVTRLSAIAKRNGVSRLVFAGTILRRPALRDFRLSWALLRHLPHALRSLMQGDDGILRILIDSLERDGLSVVGAHELLPDLLATEGTMTAAAPRAADRRDLEAAKAAALAIGALDIGQAAVAIGGRAIALEGIEGTDGLLERVRELRGHGRLAGKSRGVLVKFAKPGQELRADLPAIGPATVEAAHAAGLAGIGVEAERSLLLDRAALVAAADRLGLFVVGMPRGAAA